MKRSLLSSVRFLRSNSRRMLLGSAALLAILGGGPSGRTLAQEATRNGVVLGGVTGAVIGGVIGNNHKNQAAEGALIGGAVGAVAGGLLGNHRDQAIAQQRYYEQQRMVRTYPPTYSTQTYYPPGAVGQPTIVTTTPVYGTPVYGSPVYSHSHVSSRAVAPSTRTVVRRPVTMTEVINMTRSGVSDTVIASHIQTNGVAKQLEVNDVILLSQEGVSDFVITTMQITASGGTIIQSPPSSTVVVPSSNSSPVPGTVIRREVSSGSGVVAPPLLERRGF